MWGEIQLHPYVGGALGGAVGGTLPSKAPPTQGEGGLGGGVGERLRARVSGKKKFTICLVPIYTLSFG